MAKAQFYSFGNSNLINDVNHQTTFSTSSSRVHCARSARFKVYWPCMNKREAFMLYGVYPSFMLLKVKLSTLSVVTDYYYPHGSNIKSMNLLRVQ